MFITGPEVVKTVLGEEISMEDLGGARVQVETAGNAHFFAVSEQECFQQIRKLISYLPDSNRQKTPKIEKMEPKPTYQIENLIPKDSKIPFDMRDIVRALVDDSDFFEVQERFAPNAITGFSRINGEPVGIIGNQALVLAGVLDIDASDKIARFIRFCDSFNIPLITLVDIPGYLPGSDQEHGGVIRHGAKVLYAYSEATVPKLTVILRKAYGGGYIAMCSHHLRADFVFAWPTAEIAVMGPEGAANIIFRSEIKSAKNPDEMRKIKVKEYTDKFANPYVAASSGYVDAVIAPEETRACLIHALMLTRNKEEVRPARKHGVPPF
jgi:acetyl-CoA carboxylase carboxyltransferase component